MDLEKNFNIFENSEDRLQKSFDDLKLDYKPVIVLAVRFLRFRKISVSSFRDMIDTPDTTFRLRCLAEEKTKKPLVHTLVTNTYNDTTDAEMNETLKFVLPENLTANDKYAIVVELFDKDELVDDVIGKNSFDAAKIPFEKVVMKTFTFNQNGELEVEIYKSVRNFPEFRYSLGLHPDEKIFRKKRIPVANVAINYLLKKHKNPISLANTPVVSLAASGGGYRAIIGMCGAMEAIKDAGLLNIFTYVSGLSGSAWYLSTAYALRGVKAVGQATFHERLRDRMQKSVMWDMINPFTYAKFNSYISKTKEAHSQPVTFVDYFPGYLVGKELLGEENMDSVLSEQQSYIQDAEVPFPLLASLHVRRKEPAELFQAYVEKSPFEISIPSYGIGMAPQDFGSIWNNGIIVKKYPEMPLHFAIGVVGCALAILMNAFLKKRGEKDTNLVKCTDEERLRKKKKKSSEYDVLEVDSDESEDDEKRSTKSKLKLKFVVPRKSSLKAGLASSLMVASAPVTTKETKEEISYIAKKIAISKLFSGRKGRTGRVYNCTFGLPSLTRHRLNPLCVVKPSEGSQSSEIIASVKEENLTKHISTQNQSISIADASIWKNVSAEIVLRPQRSTDLLIVMDFSDYESDSKFNYKALLNVAADAWKTGIKFPPVNFEEISNLPPKEFLLFPSDDNETPTVMWFTLCNKKFKSLLHYKPRSKERPSKYTGKKFNDFPVFDEGSAFSTMRFQYDKYDFDQLRELMYFNVTSHIKEIQAQLLLAAERKSKRLSKLF